MIKPSAGNAYILGHSVGEDKNITAKLIGLCPQHSILYDCLTAKEHLKFYGRLKSGNGSGALDAPVGWDDISGDLSIGPHFRFFLCCHT